MSAIEKVIIGLICTLLSVTLALLLNDINTMSASERMAKQTATTAIQNSYALSYSVRIIEKVEQCGSLLPMDLLKRLNIIESSATVTKYEGTFSGLEIESIIVPALKYNMSIEVSPISDLEVQQHG